MPPSLLDDVRLDRQAISIGEVADQEDEHRAAMQAMTPLERLRTVELLRQAYYGPSLVTQRVQRVLTVSE